MKWGEDGEVRRRRKGGCRLYDSVFVFKESRLAYKCTGEYNTFKVKLINLALRSFMTVISRMCRKEFMCYFII